MKQPDETWNDYLLREFRNQSNPNFIQFLDKFFSKNDNLKKYQEGITPQVPEEDTPQVTEEDTPQDTEEDETPEEPSGRTNYLF